MCVGMALHCPLEAWIETLRVPPILVAGPLLPHLQSLLQHKSDMVPWHERHPLLFYRHNWGVGPRRFIMPLLQTYANGTGTRLLWLHHTQLMPVCLRCWNSSVGRLQRQLGGCSGNSCNTSASASLASAQALVARCDAHLALNASCPLCPLVPQCS